LSGCLPSQDCAPARLAPAVVAEPVARITRRLIWLNPLLRWEGYARLSSGSRAIIEHVHAFHAVHNLESLAEFTAALARIGPRREEAMTSGQGMAEVRAAAASAA
jgi:uncharacterized protein with von Willebrand factor type A (vWA) domain